MIKKITIKDIAREAGVSIATVSNVLNEKSFVNITIREKVIDYLANLDHKRIAYINREVDLYHSIKRFEGYLDGF